MATPKKKSFDAVAESRRWRRATSKILNKMTFAEQQAFLNRSTDSILEANATPRKNAGH
ncbi:MAG: hypothetical protein PSV13_12270 [Lacunisphaera sp.]|nr:hypothetical protein [Lacunisphaera sp.]